MTLFEQGLRNIETETVTIANGASLSGSVDMGGGRLAAVIIPDANWTAANITFQASEDGTSWRNLYNQDGVETALVVGTPPAGGNVYVVKPWEFYPVRFLKIRSGTAGTPVNQGGARTLTLAFRYVA